MEILSCRNVHQVIPLAVELIQRVGLDRASRNGLVKVAPWPVITDYQRPLERVVFWPQRDANVFLYLYEALWMLAGRRDVAPLVRYAKRFAAFSDDGQVLHGAYGYRWRHAFEVDQLQVIARRLRERPDDRRCVLQMWDARLDLLATDDAKDVPCNDMATFQRADDGSLDLTVFCRSNDIVWGAYGANAVHFAFLLEYMAAWIGCPAGIYRQISINWHAYLNTLAQVADLPRVAFNGVFSIPTPIADPYVNGDVHAVSLIECEDRESPDAAIARLDLQIGWVLYEADHGFQVPRSYAPRLSPLMAVAYQVLRAHHLYTTHAAPERYAVAQQALAGADASVDWVAAAQQWLARRAATFEAKLTREAVV